MDHFIVLDFETTGLSPETVDRAIEIGAVRVKNGKVIERFQSLMNPGRAISPFIEAYTGITNDMINESPSCAEVMTEFAQFIGDSNLIAHNASFDRRFLESELKYIGKKLNNDFACSMVTARRVFPNAPNYKLETLVDYCGLNSDGSFHRALADSEMTVQLWLTMIDEIQNTFRINKVTFDIMKGLAKVIKSKAHSYLWKIASEQPTIDSEQSAISSKITCSIDSLSNLINSNFDNSLPFSSPLFSPTNEQKDILKSVCGNHTVKILALAGTGKTTTLQYITNNIENKFLYLAFNRSIVDESRGKFRNNVTCRTIHSLAYQGMKLKSYPSAKLTGALTGPYLVDKLKIQDRKLNNNTVLKRFRIGSILCKIIENYCHSSDTSVTAKHFPESELQELPSLGKHIEYFIDVSNALWSAMLSLTNDLTLGHSGYLKAWQLSTPQISGYHYILLDEAQDSNECTLDIVLRQNCKKVIVGDPFQAIYEWRGAIGDIEAIHSNETKYLTKSFRFNSTIANFVNIILDRLNTKQRLIGLGIGLVEEKSIVTSEEAHLDIDAVMCSSNLSVVTILSDFILAGHRATVMGGASEIIDYVQDAKNIIENNRKGESRFFIGINNKRELSEFLETAGHNKGEVTRFLQIISMPEIIEILNKSNEYREDYTIVVSTIWKAKGREWDVVLLDELISSSIISIIQDNTAKVNSEKMRLLYVAATRAKRQLVFSSTNPIQLGNSQEVTEKCLRKNEGCLPTPGSKSTSQPFKTIGKNKSPSNANPSPQDPDVDIQAELCLAARQGELSTVKYYLQIGADPNTPHKNSREMWSPLHCSTLKIAELLLKKHGANVNPKNKFGQTPLMLAASAKASSMVKLLIEAGADVLMTDTWGKTALDYAKKSRHSDSENEETVELLQQAMRLWSSFSKL
ncbi:MAG: ankyrin repeat domain-containing protein [Chlorobium sp.]|nr:ankyrin repeat domain-containing protein [Chlorobium sp.]